MGFEELYGQVKGTVEIAAEKINRTADIAALQVKLGVSEHKLNEAFAELGRASFEYFDDAQSFDANRMAKLLSSVKAAKQVRDNYQKQIEELKSSSVKK